MLCLVQINLNTYIYLVHRNLQHRSTVMHMKKSSLIGRNVEDEIEEFYISDKNNIYFWLAQLERYSPKKVIQACLLAGAD